MGKNDIDNDDAEWVRIEQALKGVFTPPAGLEGRILQSVRQKAPAWERRPARVIGRRWNWLRYAAAAIAVLALLSIVVLRDSSVKESGEVAAGMRGNGAAMELAEPVAEAAVEPVAEAVVEKDYRLDRPLPEVSGADNRPGRRMPLKMAAVASNSRQASGTSQFHVGISPVVQHVWIVSDLEKAEALLKHICDVNGKKATASMKNSEGVVYSFSLTDVELQNLVNILHGEQWHLVSPDYPQPSEEYNVAFMGRNVDYGIRIVKQ